jgi:acyl carrier protein
MTILEAVRKELGQHVDVDHTLDELGLDSLELIDLVRSVETDCNITIPDEEIGQLETIGDLVAYGDTQQS